MVRVGPLLKNKDYVIVKKHEQFSKRRSTTISANKVLGHVRNPSGRNLKSSRRRNPQGQREKVMEEERNELRKEVEGKI